MSTITAIFVTVLSVVCCYVHMYTHIGWDTYTQAEHQHMHAMCGERATLLLMNNMRICDCTCTALEHTCCYHVLLLCCLVSSDNVPENAAPAALLCLSLL